MNMKENFYSITKTGFLIFITMFIAIIGLPCLFLPRKYTAMLIHNWSKIMLFLFRKLDNLDWEVIGEENIPRGPFIVASKHQSIWDTVFFTAFFADAAMVLKKIIIFIPFYGWHAIKAKMIWLDRGAHSKALKRLIKQGEECSKNNRPIIIFPEGTRSAVGEKGEYKSGISALYKFLGIPCIPVALDSGLYWQTKGLGRNPGKISVKFMPAIPSGLSRKDFERKLEETIEEETNLLINK
jgi:1-acyl-sn-glycerol-3-phosphate acyltransferase